MYILLINQNPVVSRLLSLCTRDESIILEEIANVQECTRQSYDIIFVDEASYKEKAQKTNTYPNSIKKVLFTHTDTYIDDFDMHIKKPFLPSDILEVLDTVNHKQETSKKSGTQVLDNQEVEKIKELLEMSETDDHKGDEKLSEEEYEARKIEVIKQKLIAEGLEIIEEKEIVEGLNRESLEEISKFSAQEKGLLGKNKKKKMAHKSAKKKKKKLAPKNDDLVVQAVEIAVRSLKKKQRKQLLKGKAVEITVQIEGKR